MPFNYVGIWVEEKKLFLFLFYSNHNCINQSLISTDKSFMTILTNNPWSHIQQMYKQSPWNWMQMDTENLL